jgi:hypothetical protein
LELAAEKLLDLPSWSEEAPWVLLHQPQGGVSIAPIQGLAGLLEPISIPGFDAYARLRLEGKGMDEALQAWSDQPRVDLSQDRDPEPLEPLVSAPQIAEFVALDEKGCTVTIA